MRLEEAISGMRVRCIDGKFSPDPELPYGPKDIALPTQGKIYTIRQVVQTMTTPGLLLSEIRNLKFHHDIGGIQEPCFSLERFEVC